MDILWAALIGFLVGISGTVFGGLVIYRFGEGQARQSALIGLSGGIMVAVVLLDLWPEALHYGGWLPAGIGTGLGIVIIRYFETMMRLFPWYERRNFPKSTRLGLLMGMGIGTHNFPEGVALGTMFIANPFIGYWGGLGVLMALHNIPEGMVMASALKLGKVRFSRIVAALFLVEVPMAAGAMIGAFIGRISGWSASLALGFAGGAMIFLVMQELLPMAQKIAGLLWTGFGFVIGFCLGIVLVRVV